jgi:alpha-amylase
VQAPAAPLPSQRSCGAFRPPWGAARWWLLVTVLGCGGPPSGPPGTGQPPDRPLLSSTYRASGQAAAGDVMVHLFEWPWADVAKECESVLGPAGVAAVQVSPPQEHSVVPSHDWSERYQPVSYSLARSRSGTEAAFVDMVQRCDAVGVGIIVDAVINHMTNFPSPGVGSNGTAYTKYSYPGLYTSADFHPPCALNNHQSAANVQDCELFSLPDLNTGLERVRQRLADYLVMLARLGVAGFRIDAAKHIQQVELDDIIDRANLALVAEGRPRPYVYLEVAGGAGEALGPRDYFGVGNSSGGASDITEFTYTGVANKFLGVNGEHLAQLNPEGTPGNRFSEQAWGLMPHDKAVVFLQNHDTQHLCGLGYSNSVVFRLANVWMLAQPYGYPSILSSYGFNCPAGNAMGPRSDAQGFTLPVQCEARLEDVSVGDWACEHRDRHLRTMVAFRRVVAGTPIQHWWDNGSNAIAFSRGSKGFVAINREVSPVELSVTTGLATGDYCDRITGEPLAGGCTGTVITVQPNGSIQLQLAPNSAVAIDQSTRP